MGDFEFFGIELDGLDRVPGGLLAWELNESWLTLGDARQDKAETCTRTRIHWDWLAVLSAHFCSWTGELSTDDGHEAIPRRLALTTNSYIALENRAQSSDDVVTVEYDKSWPERYEEFASWLRTILDPATAPRIEYYGSTAIPGMPAKPIIDVLVEIPSFDEGKRALIPHLIEPRWEYWWYRDHPKDSASSAHPPWP